MASAAAVDRAYAIHAVLQDAGSRIVEHEADFASLLTLTKTRDSKTLQLTVPLLSQFVHHFPEQVVAVIDCFVDLCEEDDLKIRLVAIKELPTICRNLKEQTGSVADVLTQLLQSEVPSEYDEVCRSFHKLIRIDAKASLASLVNVAHAQPDYRSKAISFLCSAAVKSAIQALPAPTAVGGARQRPPAAKPSKPNTAPLLEYLLELVPPLVQEVPDAERYQLLSLFDDLQITTTPLAQRLLDLSAIAFTNISPDDDNLSTTFRGEWAVCSSDMSIPSLALHEVHQNAANQTQLSALLRCLKSLQPHIKSLSNTDKLLVPVQRVISDFTQLPAGSDRVSLQRAIVEFVIATRNTPELESVYKILLDLLPVSPRDGEEEKLIDFSLLEPVFLLFQTAAARHPVQAQQLAGSSTVNDTLAPRLKHLIAVTQQHFTDLQTAQKQLKVELETTSNPAAVRAKLAKVLLPYWTIRTALHCSKLLLQTPVQFQCRLDARSWRLEELQAKQDKAKLAAPASTTTATTATALKKPVTKAPPVPSVTKTTSSSTSTSTSPSPAAAAAAAAAAATTRKRVRDADSSAEQQQQQAPKRPKTQQQQKLQQQSPSLPARRVISLEPSVQPSKPQRIARVASSTTTTQVTTGGAAGRRVVVVSR